MVLNMNYRPFDLFIDSIGEVEIVKDWTSMKFSSRLNLAIQQLNQTRRDRQIWHATSIQAGMWPAVRDNHSVLAISDPQRGKSFGWILPMLDKLMPGSSHEHLYEDLPEEGLSPLCIVLAPFKNDVKHIAATLAELVDLGQSGEHIRVSSVHDNMEDMTAMINLTNGADILVTTPPCLKRYLIDYETSPAQGLQLVNMMRTCHLVIEDAHISLSLFPNEMTALMAEFCSPQHAHKPLLPHLVEPRKVMQVIIVSEQWSPVVSEFYNKSQLDFTVLISDMLETVLFKGISITAELKDNHKEKFAEIVQVLRTKLENSVGSKAYICCKDSEAGNLLNGLLLAAGYNPVLLDQDDCHYTEISWKLSGHNVVIITDNFLETSDHYTNNILSGNVLIHWDLPQRDVRTFKHRFGLVKDANQDSAHILILISSENTVQAKDLHTMLVRCGVNLPGSLSDFLTECLERRKANENELPLCQAFISTGYCRGAEAGGCLARHNLNNIEPVEGSKEDDLKMERKDESKVRFSILKAESSVKYWIKIIPSEIDSIGQVEDNIQINMAMHFSKQQNRTTRLKESELIIGKLCACIDEIDGMVARVKILNLHRKKIGILDILERIEIREVDTGNIRIVKPETLHQLPDTFADVPPLAVLAVITGPQPDLKEQGTTNIENDYCPLAKFSEIYLANIIHKTADVVYLDDCQRWQKNQDFEKFVSHFD